MLRRQMLIALPGLLAIPTTGGAATSSGPRAASTVIDLDAQLNRAIVAHDVASAAALYDDDFLLTVSGGGLKRKAGMLADIGNADIELSACETIDASVRVRMDTAVLVGTLLQAGAVNGRPFEVRLQVTDTWVRVDGRWKLLAGHASVLK